MENRGWIGVDFDGTLSVYEGWKGKGVYGPPVPRMLARVVHWLERGFEVRIMTARAVDEVEAVQDWCEKYGLPRLPVTDRKDFHMIELWDDRVVRVYKNTGEVARGTGVTDED